MARARNIKPGLFKNEVLGVADPLFTLLFEGLWILADRDGRLEDRPLRIKAEVFPYRSVDCEPMLAWLQAHGFIRRYEVDGKRYILILEFVKHQNPHKNESESVIPPPEGIDTFSEKFGSTSEEIGSTRADSLIPDPLHSVPTGTGTAAPASDPEPDAIWDVGVKYLVEKGATERGARGFLGKMRKHLGNDMVAAELIAAAQKQQVSEPIPWLRAAAQKRSDSGRTKSGVAL